VQGNQSGVAWGNAGGNSLAGAVDTKNTRFSNELQKYEADQKFGFAGFAKDMLSAGIGAATGGLVKLPSSASKGIG
jgi:hypothetical protein